MSKELIINVSPTEVTIALAEDKVLVELSKEKSQGGFAVGDIYLGRVRKIMPGLNAAFVNVGHEKDAFIHFLDLGPQFDTLHKYVGALCSGKRSPRFENLKLEPSIDKVGKLAEHIQVGDPIMVQVAKEAISTKGGYFDQRSPSDFGYLIGRTQRSVGSIEHQGIHITENPPEQRA